MEFHPTPARKPRSRAGAPRKGLGGRLPALMLVGLVGGLCGLCCLERVTGPPKASASKPQQPVTVRRPLPPGVTEDQVGKWVPIRQVSGRTELAPWTSVDGGATRDPEALTRVLNANATTPSSPPAPKPAAPKPEEETKTAEPPAAQPKPETVAEPKPAPKPSGLLDRLRARFAPVKPAPDAPSNPQQVPQNAQSRPPQVQGAFIPVNPGYGYFYYPATPQAGYRQYFYVEPKAAYGRSLQYGAQGSSPQQLEPALRVPQAGQYQRPYQQVPHAAYQNPRPGLTP